MPMGQIAYNRMCQQGIIDRETQDLLALYAEVVQPSAMGGSYVPMLIPGNGPMGQPLGLMRRLQLVHKIRAEVLDKERQ